MLSLVKILNFGAVTSMSTPGTPEEGTEHLVATLKSVPGNMRCWARQKVGIIFGRCPTDTL